MGIFHGYAFLLLSLFCGNRLTYSNYWKEMLSHPKFINWKFRIINGSVLSVHFPIIWSVGDDEKIELQDPGIIILSHLETPPPKRQ